jgi:hypothetical protein
MHETKDLIKKYLTGELDTFIIQQKLEKSVLWSIAFIDKTKYRVH